MLAGPELARVDSGQVQRSGGIRRDLHLDAEGVAVELPRAAVDAKKRLMARASRGKAGAGTGAEPRTAIARLDRLEAGQVAVHPIANRSKRIVVERIHARRIEALI